MRGYIAQRTVEASLWLTAIRYGGAVLAVVVAVPLALWLQPVLDAAVVLLMAVVIAAWFSGLWPALLASLLSALALDYFFIPPLYSVSIDLSHIPRLMVFAVIAAVFTSVSAGRRSAERSLKQIRDLLDAEVRERTAELTRANQRLETQYGVTRVLARSDTLEAAAPEVLQIIGTHAGWQWGALWTLDTGARVLRRASTWGAPGVDAQALYGAEVSFTRGQGLPGRVWESGQAQWIVDVAQDDGFVRAAFAARAAIHGAVAFPVLVRNDVTGVIEFFSTGVRRPDQEQLDTLSAVAGQIGQFIERRRAENERERLLAREREAHAEALAAQQRFRDLVNSIEGIVWEADARTFQFSFVSRQAERVLGYPVAQWLQEPTFWRDHIHADDREWAVNLCVTATAERRNRDFEYRMVASDGRVVWLRDLVSVVVESEQPIRLRGVMFDVTARKHAEQALREQADLLNLTHDTIFVRDMNDVIRYWNRGAAELYGWTSEEAVGQVSHRLTQTIFPAPLDVINAQLFARGRWEGELVHTRRAGSQVVVASRWSLQRDPDGRPVAILESNNDITERKRAEDALRASEEQWKAVFENNPTMYFMVDQVGTVLSVNPFGAEQLGYTVQDLIGQSVLKVFAEADWDAVRQSIAVCLEQFGQVATWEIRKVRRDGSVIWVRETAKAMRRTDGTPVVLIACEDITLRKRAEADLRDSEWRYRHIFQSTGVSIWEEDFSAVKASIDGARQHGVRDLREYLRSHPEFVDEAIARVRIADVNDATLKLFGARSKEELLVSLDRVFTPDTRDVFAGELVAIAEGQTSFEGETVMRKLNGERMVVLFSVSFPPPDGAFDAVLVSIMDITDRKRAEQELEELAGRLIHAQEQERSRIGRELHDHISQMLGVLTIRIDQLRADNATPPRVAAALEELRQSTAEITTDIHSLSHRLHSSALDYLGLVPALQRLINEFSARHGITIDFAQASIPAPLPSEVALSLFRVAEESLANVAKHSHAKSARVCVTGEPDGIHLTVEDAGAGFEIDGLERQAGLGFVSMRERLRAVRGTVRVESAPSRGTRIEVWVPAASLGMLAPGEAGNRGELPRQASSSVTSA